MSDLISRGDAVSRISDLLMIELQGKGLPTWNEVYNAINGIPSAEPERKVGEWYHDGSQWNHWICSECEYMWLFRKEEAKFCPNCGADMRGNHE